MLLKIQMKMKIALFPILGMVLCFFGGILIQIIYFLILSFCIFSGNVSSVEMEARRPKNCKKPNVYAAIIIYFLKYFFRLNMTQSFL